MGSEAHKALFCRTLLDTFNPYKPAVIDWPKLDDEARERLRQPADLGHRRADRGARAAERGGLCRRTADPLLRKAIELNAFEEGRHKRCSRTWSRLMASHSRPSRTMPCQRDPEWAFMVTGYSECIDSFFAFGLFESAKRSGFFPEALVDTFEPVIQEEGRHILFFVNWVAWHRRNMPLLAAAFVRIESAGRLAVSHLGTHRHRPRHGQRRAGQQFHRDRRKVRRQRHQRRRADRYLPRRETTAG